jgi:hypothetical protein
VLSGEGRQKHLVIKDRYSVGARYRVGPPKGHRFEPHARPAIAQDASSVAIGLVDRTGEKDLGVLDARSQTWRVLDYAWEPTASAAPVLTGTFEQRRAIEAVKDLMSSWNLKSRIQRSLLMPHGDPSVIPVTDRWIGLVTRTPVKGAEDWVVPGVVYGHSQRGRVFRAIDFRVSTNKGALLVEPTAASESQPLRTVADAVAFASIALQRDIPTPPVPAGTRFLGHSFQAWTSGGRSMVGFEMLVPNVRRGDGRMGFGFGAVSFMEGCGDTGIVPEETQLGSSPALVDSGFEMHQVIWPATREEDNSIYSVSGTDVSKKLVLETARELEAATR